MSHAADKSNIPDEQLVRLTTEKLQELYAERRELSDKLIHMYRGGSGTSEERDLVAKQIENHDAAYEKLTSYREDMQNG